jgi:hypothetical protein
VAAIELIRATNKAGSKSIYVDDRLAAHAALLMPEYGIRIVRVVPPLVDDPNAVLLKEGTSLAAGSRNFIRERGWLDGIARKRYFEISVVPARRPN